MSDYDTAARIFRKTQKPTKNLHSTAVVAACADHLFILSMTDGGSAETVRDAIGWLQRRLMQYEEGALPTQVREWLVD